MIKKIIGSIVALIIICCTLTACTDAKQNFESESKQSLQSGDSLSDSSYSFESRVEITSKLSEEKLKAVTGKFSEAEAYSDEINLSEDQDLVPVILAQTDNIQAITITDNATGIPNVTEVAFLPDVDAVFDDVPVDVEGYQIGFVRIIYNAKLSQIKEFEINESRIVICDDEEKLLLSQNHTQETEKTMFNFYYTVNENTICTVVGFVEDTAQLTKEFAQKIKDDFICKPLSEL